MSNALDSESQSDRLPGHDEPGQPKDPAAVAVPTARLWPWAVGAGLAAGLAAWFLGERLLIAYQDELTPNAGPFPPPAVRLAVIATKKLVATLTFVALGANLGLALSVAGGAARRSVVASVRAGLAGLFLGGVAAGAAALGLLPIYFANHEPLDDSLLLPLMTHAGVAAAAGAAGGLALALGMGGWVGPDERGGAAGGGRGSDPLRDRRRPGVPQRTDGRTALRHAGDAPVLPPLRGTPDGRGGGLDGADPLAGVKVEVGPARRVTLVRRSWAGRIGRHAADVPARIGHVGRCSRRSRGAAP